MRPGSIVFTVTPSRATSRASCLNAASRPLRCAVESISPGIGSRTLLDDDAEDAPEAALAHARHRGRDQRDRREHELAVGLLPLVARERERVRARRAARRCS